jgi:hypothetical protein
MSHGPVSAVPGMTLPEVRKALGKIRHMWTQATPENPLFISSTLVGDNTIAEFCTRFVYNHHIKRHLKSAHQRAQMAEAELASGGDTDATMTLPVSERPKGVPGPKGLDTDPFPFTPGWKPSFVAVDSASSNFWWTQTRAEPKTEPVPQQLPPHAAPTSSSRKKRKRD